MKKICLAICCALSSACAFIPDFYSDVSRDRNTYKSMQTYALEPFQEVTDLGNKYVYEKSYELNRRNFSAVNEPVMRVLTYTVGETARNQVSLAKEVRVKTDSAEFVLPAKTYSVRGTVTIDGVKYIVLDGYKKYYVMLDADLRLQNKILYEDDGMFSKRFIMLNRKAELSPKNAFFKRKIDVSSDRKLIEDYEIVYEGIKDGKLAFFYKQSVVGSNGNAGSYDTLFYPKDSTMINLANVMMQIIRADNERIEYRYLKEF